MSTETPTPRVDAMSNFLEPYLMITERFEAVPADLARQLERENAELRGSVREFAIYLELYRNERVLADKLRAILNQ